MNLGRRKQITELATMFVSGVLALVIIMLLIWLVDIL